MNKGWFGWQKFAVAHSSKITKLPNDAPNPQYFLGVLGSSGLAAYFGLKEIGKIKKGDIVVVSAASGAVGELAVGLARIWGCEVVGVAGSQEKCDYVTKVLGATYCVNYKKENVLETLRKVCPNGIEKNEFIFFLNSFHNNIMI
jgi:NADPH-dependent curcumin reductase CurA